jgi:type IV secretion system protein TrbL
MVIWPPTRARGVSTVAICLGAAALMVCLLPAEIAFAQEGEVLTTLQNQVIGAAKGWEMKISEAARSLFWILAGIEFGVAAIWLALKAAPLDAWFSEVVHRILFIGFFAFVLEQGPSLAKAIVDSLFQIGADGGSASPADIFNAGLLVATALSEKIQFGVFEDNALAISASIAMVVVVLAFSLVAAIFVSVMVEMYVGLLAGVIMLGLGGSSHSKDFAIRYLVYAFSVGMKMMALVMIARIGSETLLALADDGAVGDAFRTPLAIAGLAVVIFLISIYVPNILQGVVQGVSVGSGMEALKHGGQAASAAVGGAFFMAGAAATGMATARSARSAGASVSGAAAQGLQSALGSALSAAGSAAKEKAIRSPGSEAGSLMGLANEKLDRLRAAAGRPDDKQG